MSVLSPEFSDTLPPLDLLPLPTTILMLPAVPRVAEPERRVIWPLLPELVVPDVKESELDTEVSPPLAVRTLKAPLDFARP